MTTETLTLLAGSLLSLGFSYIPGLAGWYNRLGEGDEAGSDGGTAKRLLMLALLAVVAAGAFGLACSGWGTGLGLALTCSQSGAAGLVRALALAIIANQSIYAISPRPGRGIA
jgi:hypothetical protein